MKITITRAKLTAALKKAQAADQKAAAKAETERKAEYEKRKVEKARELTQALADLKSKGCFESVGGIYDYERDRRRQAEYEERYGHTPGQKYDKALLFVEHCEDESFVLDVDRDKTGLVQVLFEALKVK